MDATSVSCPVHLCSFPTPDVLLRGSTLLVQAEMHRQNMRDIWRELVPTCLLAASDWGVVASSTISTSTVNVISADEAQL